MPAKTVVDAVQARLGATFNGIKVIGAGTTGDPPKGLTEFLIVQFPVGNNERMTINQARYRESGGFRIVFNTARGHGLDRALTVCEQLGALFRDQKFGGVTCQVPNPPFIDDSNDQGNFLQVSMAFPYTFNF